MNPPDVSVAPARPEIVTREVPRRRSAWSEIVMSADHKQVGINYLTAAFSFAVLALVLLVLMRIQLLVPDNSIVSPSTFFQLLSAYAPTALVFFAIPVMIGFATYVGPLQIGARGVAFPQLGALSFWLYLAGGILLFASFIFGPSDAGTQALPPLSDDSQLSGSGVDLWIVSVALGLLGFVLQAVNLSVTLRRMRAPGLFWRRAPIFTWASNIIVHLLLVAAPVMLAALTMLFIDRNLDGVFFDAGQGGAPVLYQHLSFFFQTVTYVALTIFAIGAITEIFSTFSGQPPFSHRAIYMSLIALAGLGSLVWIQNMYTSPSVPIGVSYAAMAIAIAMIVPYGVIFFNWVGTLAGGAVRMRAPMLFAVGAASMMAFGLTGELMQSVIPVGSWLGSTMVGWQDTHYALIGAAVFGGLAALHYWFPKITGRTMGETLAKASFGALFLGTHLMLLPMFFAGLEGQAIEVNEYFDGSGLTGWNVASTIGSLIFGLGLILALVNVLASLRNGPEAGHDPWRGDTLEWFALSPPPIHNFDVVPDVRSGEPLRDIRTAIRDRIQTFTPPAPPLREPERAPVAAATAVAEEPAGASAEPVAASAEEPATGEPAPAPEPAEAEAETPAQDLGEPTAETPGEKTTAEEPDADPEPGESGGSDEDEHPVS